jgi:hypothetical protein
MMRLRRASVFATLSLLAWAATASAECAWVLWLQVYDPISESRWSLQNAHETKGECDTALEKAGKALVDGGNFELDSKGSGFRSKRGPQHVLYIPKCLPSDTDPRGPKAK